MRKDRLVSEVLGEELAITPSDLYSTEFKNSIMGGYDKAEVDAFLERVGDAFEALINRIRELKEDLETQRERVVAMRDMEHTLRQALVSAQKFSEDVKDAARREADAIIEQAKIEKARARLALEELPIALREEITLLKSERDRLRADIRAVLATHSGLLYEMSTSEKKLGVQLPEEMTPRHVIAPQEPPLLERGIATGNGRADAEDDETYHESHDEQEEGEGDEWEEEVR